MIIRRMDEILNNLVNYLEKTDVITHEEGEKLMDGKFGELRRSLIDGESLHNCFKIIQDRCSDAMTSEEFYGVLTEEIGISLEELTELKEMKISYTTDPVFLEPAFVEEMER